MIYAHFGKDHNMMVQELMQEARIEREIQTNMRIIIKPNLVLASSAENGATTHPEIVEAIIRFLHACGAHDICIAEGAWVGERKTAFSVCGYTQLAHKYGVRLFDTKKDETVTREIEGRKYQICKSILDADYIINVPVLKGHCQTKLTCCMKNLKGCIPDSEKRRYHTLGLHQPIADLNALLRPQLHIVDGICGDLTFEEGGTPVQADRIMLCRNAVEMDSYCATLIGYDPHEIEYLEIAGIREARGDITPYAVHELGTSSRPKQGQLTSGLVERLAEYIEEDGACSACYAALIFALNRKKPKRVREKLKIGQGFRGKCNSGYGVGNCTAGCTKHVTGCPPTASEIINWMKDL